MTLHRLAPSAILLTLLALVSAAQAQTWIGAALDNSWNDDLNWDTDDAPNLPTAVVTFPVNPASNNVNNVNIQSSVQAASLTFTNIFFGNYNLTSSSGQTLSRVLSINVASGVTTTDTINLANIGSGSLLFPTTLTITNGAALGASPTLVIGPNTVINSQGGSGGIVVGGTGFTTISGTIVSGVGSLTKNGTGTLTLSGANFYTGGTTVSAGVLSIAADGNLGLGAGSLTLNGGTLQFTGAGSATALIAGRFLHVGSSGGTIDTSGLGATTGNVTTIASIITGSGPLTLAAHGDTSDDGGNSNSLLTFSGPSTFTGTVTITSGLVDAASSCFGNAANAIIITAAAW
jgi:autotransporter-associated beta strand protein